jgi:hypothetical protein
MPNQAASEYAGGATVRTVHIVRAHAEIQSGQGLRST